MRRLPRCALICVGILAGVCGSLPAQEATANRNVNLRRDPSTSSPVIAHLVKGDRLTLVDATASSGFYHVRTENDQVGWVWAKYVTVSPAAPAPPSPQPEAGAPQCDSSLWNHVYHPARLIVKQPCIAVTGTIVDATKGDRHDGVRREGDGDTHGWLKVDPEFENLLNAGNKTDEGGNLVFEIICHFPIANSEKDPKTACQGYTDEVTLPPVNSHVRIVGTLVQDTFHAKWMEIHPVTSITVLP